MKSPVISDEKISKATELVEIQGQHGNWNYDHYMQGMYNGMELVMAVIEDREPNFRSAPDAWIRDHATNDESDPELLNGGTDGN